MRNDPDLHDAMSRCQSAVTVALERAGLDPCPAIKIAQEATAVAWEVWNQQAEKIDALAAALEDVALWFGADDSACERIDRIIDRLEKDTGLPAPCRSYPPMLYTQQQHDKGEQQWRTWNTEQYAEARARLRKIIEENRHI